KGAEHLVPHVVGDAVVTLLVMKMMLQMELLDALQERRFGRKVQMLHAVAELVEDRGEQACSEGGEGARRTGDGIAHRQSHDSDGWKGGVKRAEQYPQVMWVLVMVEMNALPGRGREAALVEIAPMQHVAVQQIPDQRI